jgi:hypothetical protein
VAARFLKHPIHSGEQRRAFLGVVHREPLPLGTPTQISKKAGGIVVEMQKSPAFGVENPELFLDENRAPAQVLDHIAKRREGGRIGVFHREAL